WDEAADWFSRARTVLEEQGARPLRAITDFDEALMFQRRGAPGDRERAHALLERARAQFEDIGMSGWLRRAAELATTTLDARPGSTRPVIESAAAAARRERRTVGIDDRKMIDRSAMSGEAPPCRRNEVSNGRAPTDDVRGGGRGARTFQGPAPSRPRMLPRDRRKGPPTRTAGGGDVRNWNFRDAHPRGAIARGVRWLVHHA